MVIAIGIVVLAVLTAIIGAPIMLGTVPRRGQPIAVAGVVILAVATALAAIERSWTADHPASIAPMLLGLLGFGVLSVGTITAIVELAAGRRRARPALDARSEASAHSRPRAPRSISRC
jgi:hypothetical protein